MDLYHFKDMKNDSGYLSFAVNQSLKTKYKAALEFDFPVIL